MSFILCCLAFLFLLSASSLVMSKLGLESAVLLSLGRTMDAEEVAKAVRLAAEELLRIEAHDMHKAVRKLNMLLGRGVFEFLSTYSSFDSSYSSYDELRYDLKNLVNSIMLVSALQRVELLQPASNSRLRMSIVNALGRRTMSARHGIWMGLLPEVERETIETMNPEDFENDSAPSDPPVESEVGNVTNDIDSEGSIISL